MNWSKYNGTNADRGTSPMAASALYPATYGSSSPYVGMPSVPGPYWSQQTYGAPPTSLPATTYTDQTTFGPYGMPPSATNYGGGYTMNGYAATQGPPALSGPVPVSRVNSSATDVRAFTDSGSVGDGSSSSASAPSPIVVMMQPDSSDSDDSMTPILWVLFFAVLIICAIYWRSTCRIEEQNERMILALMQKIKGAGGELAPPDVRPAMATAGSDW